jgi:hypothetical protein
MAADVRSIAVGPIGVVSTKGSSCLETHRPPLRPIGSGAHGRPISSASVTTTQATCQIHPTTFSQLEAGENTQPRV